MHQGFTHDMPRTHGYALRGQRYYGGESPKERINVMGAFLAHIEFISLVYQYGNLYKIADIDNLV